jgi:hypothetical protein
MISKRETGKYIPAYLKDKKITVGEFALQIGACPSSVYNWMDGKPMLTVYYNALLSILREYL